MGTLNAKGVGFVHDKTRPLAVYSMEEAAAAILKQLPDVAQADTQKKLEDLARHIAWLIGFDTLIDDRKAIHHVTSLVADNQQ